MGMAELRIRQVGQCNDLEPPLFFPREQCSPSWIVSEVFVIVSLTLFLPICLEQFARSACVACIRGGPHTETFCFRDNGYLLPDKIIPCTAAQPTPVGNSQAELPGEEQRCVVKLGWLWIDSASFRCVAVIHPCCRH